MSRTLNIITIALRGGYRVDSNNPKTAQAGTLESMDCVVTITGPEKNRVIEITGNASSRFETVMKKVINETLDGLGGTEPVRVHVQDNGAMDVVLGARVEAAYKRYMGERSR
jgi:citrate lyase subunit gamma (acyl carrier protein)